MSDFDDILDMAGVGAEPGEEYKRSLDMLSGVIKESMLISRGYGGIPSPTSRHCYSSVLFTTLITRAVSLVSLAPHSEWASKVIEHWDYASAAVVTRTMLEIRLAFYYICVESCGEDEWNCRWNILNLHDCTSRRRLFEAMGDESQVAGFVEQAELLKERIKANSHFQQLPPGEQKKYLNGQQAYMQPLEDIADKAGIERAAFRWHYVLLSSHVHGLPMSYYRMLPGNPDRGRGLPSPVEEGYTTMCHALAASLLAATRDEIKVLFAGCDFKEEERGVEGTQPSSIEVDPQAPGLAIGCTMKMMETDLLLVEATRVDVDMIEIAYRYKPTGAPVLIRRESETAGSELHDLDPMFWTVRMNDKPVPEAALLGSSPGNYAFKVDHEAFTVEIKVPFDADPANLKVAEAPAGQ